MKKLIGGIAILLLFSSVAIAQNKVQTIYDTSDGLSTHQRGQAFAHWMVDQKFADFQQAFQTCNELGIPLNEMMRALKKNGKEGQFHEFIQELEHYGKQDSIPLAEFEKQLLAFNYKIKANWNKAMAEKQQPIWLVYTPNRNEIIVRGVENRKGIKLTSAVLGNAQNLVFHKKGFWFSSSNKFNSKSISSTEQSQLVTRKDSTSITFQYTLNNGETWKTEIPEISTPQPYIKTFYSNFTKIDENQRIALTWEVWGVDHVDLNSNIGRQLPAWQIMLAPESSIEYIITAENKGGKVSKAIDISVTRTFLTKATVTYYQHKDSDPKEKGIAITGEIENINGIKISEIRAAEEVIFTNDGNYYGPFTFDVTPNSIYKKELIHGKIHLSMANHGKNTWSFTPLVVLSFSDGTTTKLVGEGIKQLTDSTQKVTINF